VRIPRAVIVRSEWRVQNGEIVVVNKEVTGVERKGLYLSGYKSLGSTSGPGFDSPWERISQDLMAFVLSVVGDVPVDNETYVVTSSILRICQHSLRDASRGRVCVRVFIRMSVRVL
jgi:hypothetical protein